MSTHFRISNTVLRRFDELGVDSESLLRRAGLAPSLFEGERVLVTTEQLFGIYEALAQVSRDPGIGLKVATEERVERYDPIAIAALYARTFADALERMKRYKLLTCPEAIHVSVQGSECRVRFEWLLANQREPTLLIDTCFAWVAAIAARGSDSSIKPLRVEFQRPEAERALYEAHFSSPVVFDAPQNVLVFAASDLTSPFVTHNAEVLSMVAPQLEAELAEHLSRRTFRERAKLALKRLLAGQRPELRVVARELGVSARTLQRRLTDEAVTFQQLVAEARRELAHHYLRETQLELNETAYLLGYEDANSFFRAFQQWEGTTPGEWRARLCTPLDAHAAT
jgi:AraC-like DNA-binding protein